MFLLSRTIVGVRLAAKKTKLNYMLNFSQGVEFQAEKPELEGTIHSTPAAPEILGLPT